MRNKIVGIFMSIGAILLFALFAGLWPAGQTDPGIENARLLAANNLTVFYLFMCGRFIMIDLFFCKTMSACHIKASTIISECLYEFTATVAIYSSTCCYIYIACRSTPIMRLYECTIINIVYYKYNSINLLLKCLECTLNRLNF